MKKRSSKTLQTDFSGKCVSLNWTEFLEKILFSQILIWKFLISRNFQNSWEKKTLTCSSFLLKKILPLIFACSNHEIYFLAHFHVVGPFKTLFEVPKDDFSWLSWWIVKICQNKFNQISSFSAQKNFSFIPNHKNLHIFFWIREFFSPKNVFWKDWLPTLRRRKYFDLDLD